MNTYDARRKDYPHTFRSKHEQWENIHKHQAPPIKVKGPLPNNYAHVTAHMPRSRKACQCPKCRPSNYR